MLRSLFAGVDHFGFPTTQGSSRGTVFFEQSDMCEAELGEVSVIEMGVLEGGEEELAVLLFLALNERFMIERERTDDRKNP